ncbi:MAG: phosphomannomutase/phosphoglucomutase [Syntrophales bacterium]|jgi:phosphomannomutase/phosphoglucomutase|nr:phosphomannomutase/phosphoglucomutase [Syntrophales bacterium]MCK9527268.1 phosphomannomutase/phosphoglucomutase [Syntrophales bacterium]MDX9921262.1 phosphomannomutase/phosphoglucomutase [Syntrophales bacterium]
MNPEVFREYDVRGIVGKDLTDDFVIDLGRAIGTHSREKGVRTMALGRDTRLSSQAYHGLMMRGLASTGIDVIDIGLCASPMLYFSIRHLGTDGGVMVTGSHNPPDFNGFKICVGPDTIYGEEIQRLRVIMEREAYLSGSGTTMECSVTEAYQDYICNNVTVPSTLSIAVDGGNGVGGHFGIPVFERLGCSVTQLYCDMDGNFPNHFPDPTVEENLADLIRVVRDNRLHMGIAFDGDADRIGVISENGRIIWGDELLLLFSRFILKEHPGAVIIGEVKCSQKLYDDIERRGGRGIMWKAGHSLIKGKMKEEKALLAGEMSGHIFFADRYFGFDDAIYAAARLLEIVSTSGSGLDDLLADIPKSFTTPEIRVDCPDSLKFEVVERVTDHFRHRYDIIDIDGVRVRFDGGWGLVRASNTQPVLVMRFEAFSERRLSEIRSLVETVVSDALRQSGGSAMT